jgi:hypothetical protein
MRKTKRVKKRNQQSVKRRRRRIRRGGGQFDTYIFVSTGYVPRSGAIIYFSSKLGSGHDIYSDPEGENKIGELEEARSSEETGVPISVHYDYTSCTTRIFQITNVKFRSNIGNEWRYNCNLICVK